jgi:hypothetical protein
MQIAIFASQIIKQLYPGQYADQAKAVVKFRLKYIPVHDKIGDVDGFLN